MLPEILNRHRKIGLSNVPQSDTNSLGPRRNGSETRQIPASGVLTAVKPALCNKVESKPARHSSTHRRCFQLIFLKREASAELSEVVSFWNAACSARGDLPAENKLQVASSMASDRASSRLKMCVHNSSLGMPENRPSVDLASRHCCISAAILSQAVPVAGSGNMEVCSYSFSLREKLVERLLKEVNRYDLGRFVT